MAYFVALVSAWLLFSAVTALRPSRRGILAALAYPVGWAAGELPAQSLVVVVALWGLLEWWGWPRTQWLGALVAVLIALVTVSDVALVVISFDARRRVPRALATSDRRLESPRARDDHFGSWWRTALQFSYHPRHMQLIRDVAYGPAARHRLDVWRTSTTPQGAPVIFYVHGGAWTFGDKRDQGRPMLHEFVERGWVAVSCNYRLAPGHPWPAQIEDVTRTLGWIKRYISNYGGDPDRVVVAGGSAGGHLAALLALSADDPTWRPSDVTGVSDWSVRGAIPYYGVLEMTGDETFWRGLGRGLRGLLESRVVQLPYANNEAIYHALSPLHRLHLHAPPFLVVQGGNDTLVDVHVARGFVEAFRRRATAAIYYVELPFAQHAFDVSASPRTSATTRAAVAFATSVTEPRPVLDAALVARYLLDSDALLIEVSSGQWVRALDAVATLGPFSVVTADNPYSQLRSDEQNDERRQDLLGVLGRHGVRVRSSVARASGEWPDEVGFALVDQSAEFARSLARSFDQFAYFEVTSEALLVRASYDGALLG